MLHPNPIYHYDNDDKIVNVNNFADTFLCYRPKPSNNLLAEAALKAFKNKYPNEEIKWNNIHANLRLDIDNIYDKYNLWEQFSNSLDPVYFNINDYVDHKEN